MKLKTIAKSLIALSAVFVLGACGNNASSTASSSNAQSSASELKTVKIASVGSDADIWRHIAESEQAKKAGLKIEVQEINGGVPLNESVADGTVDANAFQSIGYLQGFNEANSNKLVPVGTTYIEPMGLYSKKVKSLNDLPNGAKVALPDNPYNTTRALRLLESAGLIKLSSDFKDGIGTPSDIVENKKNLEFLLIDDTTSVRVLDDTDLIAIGNTIALEGGLNVLKDSLFYEKADASTITSINVIAVKAENADKEEYKKLVDLYHDPEIQKYISEQFAGTKVEVKKPVSEVWGK
jgi:ABC superfamily ATP binding cassette transporter, substrate-binding protein